MSEDPKEDIWPLDFLCLLDENTPKTARYEMRLETFQELRSNPKTTRGLLLEELAQLVMIGSHYFIPIESKKTYYYHCDLGIWLPRAERMIEALCRYLWPDLSRFGINEVIAKIRNHCIGSISIFDRKMVVGVENGVIDLTTWELKKHSPDYYSTKAIPVRYDPKEDCPNIREFLSSVTGEENIRILEEAIGYCLWPEYCYQRGFVLFGPTQTGKSTFLKLLKIFLGPKNTSNMTLQQLTSRQFGLAKLKDRFANIAPDMPQKMVYETGTYKALVASDAIDADVKYDESAEFQNTAKLFFSANKLPPTKYDDDDSYYGKWIILDFPNQFLEKADENLINKLTTPEELSGLLNLAISGLRRLRIRGRFEKVIDLPAKKRAYLLGSDTTKAFLYVKCNVGSREEIVKEELYSAYSEFCHTSGRTPIPYNNFTKTLRKWMPEITTGRVTIQGSRHGIYKGVSLNVSKFRQGVF